MCRWKIRIKIECGSWCTSCNSIQRRRLTFTASDFQYKFVGKAYDGLAGTGNAPHADTDFVWTVSSGHGYGSVLYDDRIFAGGRVQRFSAVCGKGICSSPFPVDPDFYICACRAAWAINQYRQQNTSTNQYRKENNICF